MEKKNTGGGEEICVIWSTVPPALSGTIATGLLEKELAACVNITPVRSLYRWKGECCDDEEHLLIIKTRRGLADAAIAALRAVHPYEVPEIIVLPVIAGHPPYLAWVYGETKGP
jgi:periplasmic divalent cation tolerance protein